MPAKDWHGSEAQEIAFLKKKVVELERLVVTDPLTGVYNHRYFRDRLYQEMCRATRHKSPLCLLMIDIDAFKKCNDAYGHLEGDCLLVKIANVLNEYSRSTDIVCRYGGDEFTMILPETDVASARILARKVKDAVQALDLKCEPTISVGIADIKEKRNILDLIQKADKALYQAKRSGKNRISDLLRVI